MPAEFAGKVSGVFGPDQAGTATGARAGPGGPVAGSRNLVVGWWLWLVVADVVRRYGRAARWFHAGVYLSVLSALATGWWFVLAGYERRSPVAVLTGVRDGALHEYAGYGLVAVLLLWLPFGARGIGGFLGDSLRFHRGDGRWLAGWPRALVTGRFGHHDGHFDPGQRLANLMIVGTLSVLAASGLWMLYGPPIGVDLLVVHRWSAFLATPVLLGHIIVASGVLPGYRGVWRSMHLGGRLPVDVARRLWPGWLTRHRR